MTRYPMLRTQDDIPPVYPLQPDLERRLLIEWNATQAPYPSDACIHHLFEARVRQVPDATALIWKGTHLTYTELNQRANQLAHYLRACGVGPEVLVGISLERSDKLIIGVLAILKAGGAYVPLDPSYPLERLTFMLEDAQAPVLLTQSSLAGKFAAYRSKLICHDADEGAIARQSTEDPICDVSNDHGAYLIYTSGSTGQPKGVLGTHRGAVNRFAWMWRTYPFEPTEVCCQKTSLNFLDSLWEMFGPLLQGIPVVVMPDGLHRLVEGLREHDVTRIVLVPSLLRLLLETYHQLGESLPRLKIWVSSGEALSADLVQRFYECMPDRILLNLYGLSEISADATCCDTSQPHQTPTLVSIGRPIANMRVYILDAHLRPVPIGASGELYIGGVGLARGYLGRPDLTAARFMPDPFSGEHGARLYKTGDIARYLPTGDIDYLGRVDHQVKIRGVRIELGEIETALRQHTGVRESVVLAITAGGEKRLVAFVVPSQEPAPAVRELRAFLKGKLPKYLLPDSLVLLQAMPLTPNGKVDRRRLAATVAPPYEADQGVS